MEGFRLYLPILRLAAKSHLVYIHIIGASSIYLVSCSVQNALLCGIGQEFLDLEGRIRSWDAVKATKFCDILLSVSCPTMHVL